MNEIKIEHKFKSILTGNVPSLLELEKNISFRIINTHQSMQFTRPMMPGLTYVAGIHIKPAKALPTDVQVSSPLNDIHFGEIKLIFGALIAGISGQWF